MIKRYVVAAALALSSVSPANAAINSVSQSIDLKANLQTGVTPTVEIQKFNPAFGELLYIYFDLAAYFSGEASVVNVSYPTTGNVDGETGYLEYVIGTFKDEGTGYQYFASQSPGNFYMDFGGGSLESLQADAGPKTVTGWGQFLGYYGEYTNPYYFPFIGQGSTKGHFNIYWDKRLELYEFGGPGFAYTKFDLQDLGIKGNITYYFAPAPEPAAWMLMVVGFGAVGAMIRRQRLSALA